LHLASFGLSSIPVILWQVISFRPDVVMTVEPAALCMPTSWIAARLCGANAWLHVQDFEIDAAFELGILKQPVAKKLVLAAEAFLMRRFDRVSTISPNMMFKLVIKGVDENRVVSFPNWVDCQAMRPMEESASSDQMTGDRARTNQRLRESFGIPEDKFVTLYAGNIGAKQGLEIIVEAAKSLIDCENLQFVICGTGAAIDSLRQQAMGLSNVLLLPPQPFERFNELMNCADVHLLPQRSGAADLVMPSKLTGMLATGRAVVACADRGTQIADVVDGHGIVVPAGDATAFAAAIKTLANDPHQCRSLGKAARQYALDHLSREAILSRFMADLRSLVNGPIGDIVDVGADQDGQNNRSIDGDHSIGSPKANRRSGHADQVHTG
jgi:colanic acid biosynthesis glycosyl transferase WcaI